MSKQGRQKKNRVFFSGFLLFLGVIVGAILSAQFQTTSPGAASNTSASNKKPRVIIRSEQAFVSISKAVTPVVVNILATRNGTTGSESGESPLKDRFNEFFGRDFFNGPKKPSPHKSEGSGSGVIIESNGLIVTNNHVIEGADKITVRLSDDREFIGTVVGADPKSDLAVVRINAKGLPTIPWGNSSDLQVGEYILAVGNPFGLNQTVTMGIVSAVGRANIGLTDYEDFIQTDAAINPGNSGGAMVNVDGELVGINTAIFTRSGGYMGIGFAVPSDMVQKVVGSLLKDGKVVRGWLGVAIQEVTPELAQGFGLSESRGALVSEVMIGSPAEKASFEMGDVILQFGDTKISDTNHLRHTVANALAGDHIKVRVFRDRQEIKLKVIIEVQPKNLFAQRGRRENEPKRSRHLEGVEVTELTVELREKLELKEETLGVIVIGLEVGSVAEDSGIRKGDLIMEVNRQNITSIEDYETALTQMDRSEPILLLIRRQDRTLFLTVSP